MDTPHDSWLQEQIERYRTENAASEAFYQQAASLLFARQLLASGSASRQKRMRSLGRLLRSTFRRLYRHGHRASRQPPTGFADAVPPATNAIDVNSITVIVIGVEQQAKGE